MKEKKNKMLVSVYNLEEVIPHNRSDDSGLTELSFMPPNKWPGVKLAAILITYQELVIRTWQ